MNRVIIIDRCSQCPYYDDSYEVYYERCVLLDRRIDPEEVIPDDCPLQETSEKQKSL